MARLQILELPEVFIGEASETPFVLVVDQVDDDLAEEISRWPEDVARRIGARQVLCFPGTVDIPANDTTAYLAAAASNSEPVTWTRADEARAIDVVQERTDMDRTRDWDDIRNAAAGLRKERDALAAEVERLRAGEEPVTDNRVAPTPAQWIWQWNRATPEKRHNMAAQILDGMSRANTCFTADHEAQIARLRTELDLLHLQRADADAIARQTPQGPRPADA